MKKIITVLALILFCAGIFAGCRQKETFDVMEIVDAYVGGFNKFYELGEEYKEQGLQLQADYAYGWAAASISSMRYCVDCLLYSGGGANGPGNVTGGRKSDWDEIAAMNYTSPYPWFFEGLVLQVQGMNEDAALCYEKALMNPAFDAENGEILKILAEMPEDELKGLKNRLTGLEDSIFAAYTPEPGNYPRSELGFDDRYLRAKAQETLRKKETDYRGALRHFEAALKVNPFEGDNFVGCALMSLYLDDIDGTFFYVNEGLYIDPGHEGLNRIADILNGEVSE